MFSGRYEHGDAGCGLAGVSGWDRGQLIDRRIAEAR